MNNRNNYYNLFLLLLLSFSLDINGQDNNVRNYNTDNGLPHNIGYDMLQDSKGYMWFGTDDGLARFDGTEFKVFKKSDGLLSNFVICMDEAPDGTLWIGSWKGGVNCLKKDSIFKPNLISPLKNIGFLQVNDTNLFISNNQMMLLPFHIRNGKWEPKTEKKNVKTALLFLPDNRLVYESALNPPREKNRLHLDVVRFAKGFLTRDNHFFYFGRFPGIYKFETQHKFLPVYPDYFEKDTIYHISQDKDDNYWIGAKGKISKIFNSQLLTTFTIGLPNEKIHDIKLTSGNQIYFLTGFRDLKSRGLFSFNKRTQKLINLKQVLGLKSLPAYIQVDREDNLWVATNGEGFFCVPDNPFKNFGTNEGLGNLTIQSINENKNNQIYVGTQSGLYQFKGGQFQYLASIKDETSLEVHEIIKDHFDNLLFYGSQAGVTYLLGEENQKISILGCDNGFNNMWLTDEDTPGVCYSVNSNIEIRRYKYKVAYNFNDIGIFSINKNLRVGQMKQVGKNLWVGTNKGIFITEIPSFETDTSLTFIDSLTVKKGLISNQINVFEDGKDNILWIGTQEGLCKYQNNTFTCYTEKDGLISNNCKSLVYDHNGILWIGTPKGLSYYDGKKFTSYNEKTGLISSDINCLFKDSEKKLWIGTSKGISVLDIKNRPKEIKPPPLYIEKIEVNGFKVSENEELDLGYDESLRVYFKAITYTYPEGLKYQFRLNDGIWQNTSNNYIDFNSLKYESYLFEVRAKKFNSLWAQPQKLFFTIHPPLWFTWWAKTFYVISFAILLNGFIKWRSRKLESEKLKLEKIVFQRTEALELQKTELEQQKEEITTQNSRLEEQSLKLFELDKMKSRFFTNISHEFRTPLTLVLGPLENVIQNLEENENKKQLKIAHKNAFSLHNLINQLLDLSKLEEGKLKLNLKKTDIINELKLIKMSFDPHALNKDIEFNLSSEFTELFMVYDQEKVDIVFNNLLSNAFKFTPPKGNIQIKVFKEIVSQNDTLIIKIEDSGIGVSEDNLNKIFNRFYQVDGSHQRKYEGTGIGLALTKELVELHEGKISVESEIGKGSVFIVQLPMKIDQKDLKFTDSNSDKFNSNQSGFEEKIEIKEEKTDVLANNNEISTVLIVEDNDDLRNYIGDLLEDQYHVKKANNGLKGLKIASDIMPDLIISDIMMPEMSGIEMCEQVKTNELISHIPVILLTAKAGIESKIEGLETGADDYLMKPFNKKELLTRIKNLISQRKNLRERFSKNLNLEPKEISVTSVDEKFLKNAIDVIETNMKNYDFTVNLFAKEMGMSRTQLHKKLSALTNQSASEFNRSIRLKRAASLLKQKSGNISEIGFEVGFSSLNYFGRCFSKIYGMSPSEYGNGNKKTMN